MKKFFVFLVFFNFIDAAVQIPKLKPYCLGPEQPKVRSQSIQKIMDSYGIKDYAALDKTTKQKVINLCNEPNIYDAIVVRGPDSSRTLDFDQHFSRATTMVSFKNDVPAGLIVYQKPPYKEDPFGNDIAWTNTDLGEIDVLFTNPKYLRQGIASQLMKVASEDLLEQKCSTIELWTSNGDQNKSARLFYNKVFGKQPAITDKNAWFGKYTEVRYSNQTQAVIKNLNTLLKKSTELKKSTAKNKPIEIIEKNSSFNFQRRHELL